MSTLTLQPDDTTGVDTFLDITAATTNYATDVRLGSGEHNASSGFIWRSLIKFDLSSIPADATITSAILSLWTKTDLSSTTSTHYLYRVLKNWVEAEANWNRASTALAWGTAGCNNATDKESTEIGSTSVSATESVNTEIQFSLDVTKVQEWVSGAVANYGMLLRTTTELNDMWLWHSSSGTTAAYRPKLVVEYTVGGESGCLMIL